MEIKFVTNLVDILPSVKWKIGIAKNRNVPVANRENCIEYLYTGDCLYVNNISHPDYPINHTNTDGIPQINSFKGMCSVYFDMGETVLEDDYYTTATLQLIDRFKNIGINGEIIPSSQHEVCVKGIALAYTGYIPSINEFSTKYSHVFGSLSKKTLPGVNGIQDYKPFTITSRPTNNWNRTNWASLPHDDRGRIFVNEGTLVYLDVKACHLSLIANLIGWKFDRHPYDVLMEEIGWKKDKSEFKRIIFSYLYNDGNLPHSDFFDRYSDWKLDFKRTIKKNKHITTPIFGRKIKIEPDWKLEKCINLFMQAYETETQVSILYDNADMLDKLVYYLYDGLLFHLTDGETDTFISSVEHIYKNKGLLVATKKGSNFSEMS